MEEKFEELKCYFTAKMSEQEENLTKVFNNVLNDLRKEITKQIQNEIKSHCKHLESENQMLKHQVSELKRLNIFQHIFLYQLLLLLLCLNHFSVQRISL